MDSALSQLDNLDETDMLAAFGETAPNSDVEDIIIEDLPEDIVNEDIEPEVTEEVSEIVIEDIKEEDVLIEDNTISSVSETHCTSTDLASLLSQLLNNKTIEITIKIKD